MDDQDALAGEFTKPAFSSLFYKSISIIPQQLARVFIPVCFAELPCILVPTDERLCWGQEMARSNGSLGSPSMVVASRAQNQLALIFTHRN